MIGFAGSLVLAFLTGAPTTATVPTPPPAAPAATPAAEKKICRYFAVTGSLVQRTKVCHTRKEWSQLNDNGRRDMELLSGKMSPDQSN